MANEIIKRDQNHVTVLAGVTDDSNQDVTMLRIDPVTKRLLVSATGSGSGSVTTVSVVTANGFAGTVATATTTPAITITTTITGILQGNGTAISAATTTGSGSTVVLNGSPTLITPSIAAITVSGGTLTLPTGASDTLVSRNSTDTLTNKNLTSGTNTFPTFNQNTTGTSGGLTGTPSITVATVTTTGNIELGNASDTTLSRVAPGIMSIEGAIINGYATTATAAGTTTLTSASATIQHFTGTLAQTVRLPTTGIIAGQMYRIANFSTGLVTVQSSGANTIDTLGLNQVAIFVALVSTPTTAANWSYNVSNLAGNAQSKRILTVIQSATPAMNTNNGDIMQITGLAQAITSMTTNLTGNPTAGDMFMLQITDNGTARAITWGASFSATTVALPTTTVISTMLRVGFQWNGSTWACIAVA